MEGSASLAAMKAHVERIRSAMNDINMNLAQPTPAWKDILGRYSVLSAQFHILLEELNRKDSIMFPSLAIYPKKTIPENPNQIPLLLRSKTLPELEEREKKYTQEFFTTHEITAKTEDEKAELETRVESFNAMCDQLEDHFEQSRANYSFKTKREEIPLEDNSLHLNTIIEAIMTGKGIGGGLPPPMVSPISPVTSPGLGMGGAMRGLGGQPPQKRQATGPGIQMPPVAQSGGMMPMGVPGGAAGAMSQQGKPAFMNVPPNMANQPQGVPQARRPSVPPQRPGMMQRPPMGNMPGSAAPGIPSQQQQMSGGMPQGMPTPTQMYLAQMASGQQQQPRPPTGAQQPPQQQPQYAAPGMINPQHMQYYQLQQQQQQQQQFQQQPGMQHHPPNV